MAGRDRLSDLSDDMLRRVLHFAPAKEAASTTALSRRWRSQLWRSSGAVNLHTRVRERYTRYMQIRHDHDPSRQDAFVSAAEAALHGAVDPVTRLTIHVEAALDHTIETFLGGSWSGSLVRDDETFPDVIARVLSHPAARSIQEFRLATVSNNSSTPHDEEISLIKVGVGSYLLDLCSLPSTETLRVLELINCTVDFGDVVAFPRLASLRLQHCSVNLVHLQGLIDAAPALAIVHLKAVHVKAISRYAPPKEQHLVHLSCPAVTWIVLDKCGWTHDYNLRIAVDIDAPMLRHLEYKGHLRQLSLTPQPPPDLARVNLQFFPLPDDNKDPGRDRIIFWRSLHNFINAKELKLRVNNLEDIAVINEAKRAKLLCTFRNLERLDLQGVHRPQGKTAAVAIANLLACCPIVSDLRIKLTMAQHDSPKLDCLYGHHFLERKFRLDLHESINLLERQPTISSQDDDDDDDVKYDEISDVPGLSGCSFDCLQSCITRVGLQFRLGNSNDSFGVKLIKFFAENAILLQEMYVDGGNEKMSEHINFKVERWIASSSKRKNSPANKTGFIVLPLER